MLIEKVKEMLSEQSEKIGATFMTLAPGAELYDFAKRHDFSKKPLMFLTPIIPVETEPVNGNVFYNFDLVLTFLTKYNKDSEHLEDRKDAKIDEMVKLASLFIQNVSWRKPEIVHDTNNWKIPMVILRHQTPELCAGVRITWDFTTHCGLLK